MPTYFNQNNITQERQLKPLRTFAFTFASFAFKIGHWMTPLSWRAPSEAIPSQCHGELVFVKSPQLALKRLLQTTATQDK